MKLSNKERKTAVLYGQIHTLEKLEHTVSAVDNFLTAEHLGVAANFLEGKKCLDVGCGGRGRALKGLFRLGSRDILAIDISEVNINNARKQNQEIVHCVKFETKNILRLDYADESFDFIHCSGVIHHTENPKEAVQSLYRCLSSGGWIYVGLFGKGGILYSTGNFFRLIAKLIPYKITFFLTKLFFKGYVCMQILDYLYVPYQFHYKVNEARELLSQAGFINIRRLKQPCPTSKFLLYRFLKPCFDDPDTVWGKIMAGSGWIILMAQKPG